MVEPFPIILLVLVVASLVGNFISLYYSRNIRREKDFEKREMYDALFETYEILRKEVKEKNGKIEK